MKKLNVFTFFAQQIITVLIGINMHSVPVASFVHHCFYRCQSTINYNYKLLLSQSSLRSSRNVLDFPLACAWMFDEAIFQSSLSQRSSGVSSCLHIHVAAKYRWCIPMFSIAFMSSSSSFTWSASKFSLMWFSDTALGRTGVPRLMPQARATCKKNRKRV